jgi:hypothetical protein
MKKIQNRNKIVKTNPSRRLASYLSAGVCVAGAEARAALQVTFSPSAAQIAAGRGLDVGGGYIDQSGLYNSTFSYAGVNNTIFTDGELGNDHAFIAGSTHQGYGYWGEFARTGVFKNGATSGSDNYANISFNSWTDSSDVDPDESFEAVGQFDFNSDGTGTLLAVAWDDNNYPLAISVGAAEIQAAAVPEPSSMMLGLLALGATACARRRRHAVPR